MKLVLDPVKKTAQLIDFTAASIGAAKQTDIEGQNAIIAALSAEIKALQSEVNSPKTYSLQLTQSSTSAT